MTAFSESLIIPRVSIFLNIWPRGEVTTATQIAPSCMCGCSSSKSKYFSIVLLYPFFDGHVDGYQNHYNNLSMCMIHVGMQ